jgi:bifunctional DNA-binding transcriptional regulator/antitoxin component of YhaV-PrlF toxin-antitoxin module
MTVSVKKEGISVPKTIAKRAGIRPGDVVEFTVRKGAITIRAAANADESRYPTYTPTKAEAAAIRRGREAYERGEFSTLADIHKGMDAARRVARKKVTRKIS